MRIQPSWQRPSGYALAAVLFCASPALSAPDARQLADSLAAATTEAWDAKVTYENAVADGDAVTISGYKVVRSSAKTVTIPKIVVTGAATRDPGGFTAKRIAFDGGQATRGKDVVAWKTGVMEDALVPSAEEIKSQADLRPFGKLVMTGLTMSESNLSKPITASELNVVVHSAPGGSPGAFTAEVNGVHFPAAILQGRPQEKAVLDALGYEAFDVDITAAGAFDAEKKSLVLDTLTINTADVGTVTVKAQLSGISPGKMAAARANPDAHSETKLDHLEVRFENNGVVERALDMHAALILGTREEAAAQVNAALPLFLHVVGNDAFQTKIAKAVQTFLADPKSIAFSAEPTAPVPLEQILSATRDRPQSLPDLLGADVSAN